MSVSLVFNLVSVVLIFSSLFMLLPVSVSFLMKENVFSALGTSFVLTLMFGILLYFITKSHRKIELGHKDGFAVVTFSWLTISFFGCLPYIFSGITPVFTNAYFESMAGFTTTGASVLNNLEELPNGILLWRSLTQWMGGMGIIVFSLAILPVLGAGGMQLFKAEVPDIGVEKLTPRIIDMAKSLWYIYGGLTAVLALLLVIDGMSLFDAVCHAFTTMATGGFSTKTASIAYFQNSYADIIITFFMFLAGINFALHFYALRGNISRYIHSSEFKFYCLAIVVSTLIITLNLTSSGSASLSEATRYAAFQVVSIMTTTGYAVADYELWPVFSQMLLLCLMFFGGMVGSTGGGMKQARVLLMLKQVYRELYQLIHPHALTALKLDGTSVLKQTLGGIWGFLFLFISIAIVATVGMTALGLDMITSASTVISAMSNVGPALGDAGPSENYAAIPLTGKWILIFCMLVGRLEIYTVVVLLVPHFWKT
jgi:trk system potassium uptake protein TrkH